MPQSFDLNFRLEDALKAVGREVDAAIARVRSAGADAIEQLRAVESAASEIVTVAAADHALVFDFVVPRGYRCGHVRLELGGGGMGMPGAQLSRELDDGEYRAVVLITKR